jgi:hypothetical protein
LPHEVSETIDIALATCRGSHERVVAAEDLADRISRRTPHNPITPSAAAAAILAACLAIDGHYGMAAEELRAQIEGRRAAGSLIRNCPPSSQLELPPDEQRIDALITVCLTLPPGDERAATARRLAPDFNINRALPMVDDAIDQRYPEREVLRGLKRLTMRRRSEGSLVRGYSWVPVAPAP